MESALSATAPTLTLFSISKALNRHLSNSKSPAVLARCFQAHLFAQGRVVSPLASLSYSSPLRSLSAASLPKRLPRRLECIASSTASFGTGGGGVFGGDDGAGGGGNGGGGDGTGGGDSKAKLGAGGANEPSPLSPDVIILDVGGMTCGGCAASVKRILESQPQVSSASVNLTTETAVVWPVSEARDVPNWQKELGEALARHLTSCGFKSNLRGNNHSSSNFFLFKY